MFYSAWQEAIDIAKEAYRWRKYSSHAKRDYIGADDCMDEESWDRVIGKDLDLENWIALTWTGLLYYATAYKLAGKNSPFPSWKVNITCSNWKNRCKNGVQAYTTNSQSRRGELGIYINTITFCSNAMFLRNSTKIDSCYKRRDVGDANKQYNLINY